MTGWSTRTRLAAAVVAVAVALLGAGCGSDSDASTSGVHVSKIVTRTQDAGSARFAGSSTIGPNDEDFATTFDGEVDFASDRSTFTTRALVEGKAVVERARFVDGFAYLRPDRPPEQIEQEEPAIGVFPPSAPVKEWIRSPYSGGGFGILRSGDADAMLETLVAADGAVESRGSATVRGVSTKRYRIVSHAPDLPREVVATSLVPRGDRVIDVWVDAQRRVRRFAQSIPTGRYKSNYEVEFFDFGTPVTVEAPPAADVTIDHTRQLTGDWVLVQRGRAEGNDWRVFRAPTANGGCFAHHARSSVNSIQIGNRQRGKRIDFCTQRFVGLPSTPPPPDRDLDVQAVALGDDMALLYGSVSASVQRLTLRFASGETKQLTPSNATFAAVLGGDELVERITLHGAKRSVGCPLVKPFRDYNCANTLDVAG
jgi:hypothetical protein